jgi:hypothetical protein
MIAADSMHLQWFLQVERLLFPVHGVTTPCGPATVPKPTRHNLPPR